MGNCRRGCKHVCKFLFATKAGLIITVVVTLTVLVAIIVPVAVIVTSDESEEDSGDSGGSSDDLTTTATTETTEISTTEEDPVDNFTMCEFTINEKVHRYDSECEGNEGDIVTHIDMYAAKREHEAFKIMIQVPETQDYLVSYTEFSFTDSEIVLYRATYEGVDDYTPDYIEEELELIQNNSNIPLTQAQNNVIWGVAKIPPDTEATKNISGQEKYTATVSIGEYDITLYLYVFDFEVPQEVHYFSQLNIGSNELDSDNDIAKWILLKHRFTNKSVSWPSGFKYEITWESSYNPNSCSAFYDETHEGEAYSIEYLSKRYILGDPVWNEWEMTFPTALLFEFVNNSQTRATAFCGEDIGADPCGSAAYNTEYKAFITGLHDYLLDKGMLEKAYVYVMNEPQDDADDIEAGCLCQMYKDTVPNLKIAVSEQAKPEIADTCGFDIWIAHLAHDYRHEYALERLDDHGEISYWYTLDHSDLPYINPIRVTAHGMEVRLLTWLSWKYRVRGYAFYDYQRFFTNGIPTVVSVLMREAFEDYEYLYLLNSSNLPLSSAPTDPDELIDQFIVSVKSISTDSKAFMNFRTDLGLYLEGTSATLPTFVPSSPPVHPRDNYYINFQDVAADPSADPLIVDGHTYIKCGPTAYDSETGMGFYGENIGNDSILLMKYSTWPSGFSEVQASFIYDDYGRVLVFEFDIENGDYLVTTSIGYPGYERANDYTSLWINGVKKVDDRTIGSSPDWIEEITQTVTVTHQRIVVEYGDKSLTQDDFTYCFIQYLHIESV